MELFYLLIIALFYFVACLPLYKLGEKAGYENSWFAYVPIAREVMVFNITERSGWNILWGLIPIVGQIYVLVVTYQFYNKYESGKTVGILMILSFIPPVVIAFVIAYYMLAFSDKKYLGNAIA